MTAPPDISHLRTEFLAELRRVTTERDLQDLRDRYVGRKRGAVAALLKVVSSAPADLRPTLGRKANELKQEIERELTARRKALESQRQPADSVDVTLPGRDVALGHRHPLTILREEIELIFAGLGFEILQGPEAEDDYHNFEALNMPAEHPARDMQDTLYLDGTLRPASSDQRPATLLRTHTTGMQIRYMETHTRPGSHDRAGGGVPTRQPRPDPLTDVSAGRGTPGGRERHDGGSEGNVGVLSPSAVR